MKEILNDIYQAYKLFCTAIISAFILSFVLGGGEFTLAKYHLKYDGLIKQIFIN